MVHLAVGNLEWLGPRCDDFIFIERQANRATATMMILDEFPPHFALLEGYDAAADGLVGMMGCPEAKSPMRLYAGRDALSVDIVAARHLGVKRPGDSGILREAGHWLGGWSEQIEVIGADTLIDGWRGPYHNELWALMSFLAMPVYMFGSGRGLVFVPEMDSQAFPAMKAERALLRWRRHTIRALLGLRHTD